MKKLLHVTLLTLPLLLFSCEKSDSNETGQPELPSSSLPASFTATVTGGFGDEVTSQNLLSGNKGVLFMEGTDGAKEVFNAWLEGNDNPGCKVSNRCTVQSNGTIEAVIQGLSPETTYSYALFFKTGKKRYLGGSGTFTTKSFKPVLNTGEAADIRYWDARIDGSFENLDKLDASMFTQGVMLALDDSFNDEATFKTFKLDEYSPRFSLQVDGLEAGRKYYYRTFIKSEDMDLACYGSVKSFNSKSLDEMAVDMGLSVKWANCDLGEQEFSLDGGDLYIWGYTSPSPKGITLQEYKFWDSENESYIDIGQEISGTQYDPVHAQYGGKWRMPTKADVEELLKCSMSKHFDKENENVLLSFTVSGKNGNSIEFKGNTGYLTGTLAFTDNSLSNNNLLPLILIDNNLVLPPSLTTMFTRIGRYHIRPVWDPSI